MEFRYATHPDQAQAFTTSELRQHYLMEDLFIAGETKLIYSMEDRTVIGGIQPSGEPVTLETHEHLKAAYFLERREVGIFNIGGQGSITVDGQTYQLENKDCLYVGKGNKELLFSSEATDSPAKFYLFSAPAHTAYPTQYAAFKEVEGDHLGSSEQANERVLRRFIHLEGIKSCQIVMGVTALKQGSVWNSMPTHTHHRRMEAYLYFDLDANARMFHLMGRPDETRHLVMKNEQAVLSPPWSIHCGSATNNYAFIWAMAGENQTFTDMDQVAMDELR
ncbi:5-dehydro-4-deoxy-D-glucuronate isomerase [Aureibacillus halotolerans]|uniref:4-deoxy-L-threo-5-hexosulose-uronate ketol-isomerase n=1 Tax=Aureibacillus halotolerans TaxID=1508390 RepID=A0A4V3D678_9BACI|nr:5-dehydro-4-deoxy-D-glucuronate isomerase [Aureibacillus halotolerans]TDQ42937.1 4-deoxy-L-threo-5-hexosulose-uronate ketol-isomerase [Aureibacillus halotolerans]